jgi:hypothetical protein
MALDAVPGLASAAGDVCACKRGRRPPERAAYWCKAGPVWYARGG